MLIIKLSKEEISLRKINFNFEITLTINGSGKQMILSNYNDLLNKPSQIIINNITQGYSSNKVSLNRNINEITIIWDNLNTSIMGMFYNLTNITRIDFSNFDTSNINNMSYMFSGCSSLISLDLSNFITSSVTDMNNMFSNCTNLESLNINNFNTSKVENMSRMFENCIRLTTLDLSNFDTSKVFSMTYMFCNCKSLISLTISNFNTIEVTDMSFMFAGCQSITDLDLRSFKTSNVIYMIKMFIDCFNLLSLDLSSFDTSNLIDLNCMFDCCYALTSYDLSSFYTSKVINMGHLFRYNLKLKSLNLENFDTSLITDMVGMFEGCGSLKSLNLSNFKTAKVKTMWCMFCGSSIQFLDLSSFDTSSVSSMNQMFMNCKSLLSLEIGSFNTSLVSDMSEMFENCTSLISLNLPNNFFNGNVNVEKIFLGINNNLIYCINGNIPTDLNLSISMNCSDNCFKNTVNKFIIEENKCIDNCNKHNSYKYEYNNICYQSCPKKTNYLSDNEYLCQDLLCEETVNNYYNYNQNKCIVNIDGFYVNDTIEKTIDKCDIQCQNCKNKSNLCISCNNKEGYYQKLNYTLNNDSFINCYNKTPVGYILHENIYKPCYFTCRDCSGYGDEKDNKCITCRNGFNFNIFENNSNCYNKCDYFYYFDEFERYNCTLTKNCPNKFKLIRNKSKCIDDCSKDDKYKYEFNNECFEECPNNTYNDQYLCRKIENQIETKCSSTDFVLGNCKINNSNDEIDDMINEIRKSIKEGKLDPLIKVIIKGENEDLIIEDNNITFQITSTKIQNNKRFDKLMQKGKQAGLLRTNRKTHSSSPLSIIKLGECEKELGQNIGLEDNEPLLIFKIEVKKEDSLIPCVEYEIYNYNNNSKTQLDLNICNNTKIDILFPVSNVEKDIYKHNISSDYYNDICFSYTTEIGTDIILKDRKNEFIDKSLSLCESNCDLSDYNNEIKMSTCQCEAKIKIPLIKELIIDKNKFLKKFKDINNIMNLNIMKCYQKLFTSKGLKKNIGSYILLFMILINIIFMIIFLIKGLKKIFNIIEKIVYVKKKEKNINNNQNNKDKNINSKRNSIIGKNINSKRNSIIGKNINSKRLSIIDKNINSKRNSIINVINIQNNNNFEKKPKDKTKNVKNTNKIINNIPTQSKKENNPPIKKKK